MIELMRTKPIVPPRASQGRKAAYLTEPDEIGTDGLVARFADHVFENPAMSGGLLVMALTATAIISNAMFLQNTRHPQPFFMTRPAPALLAPEVDPSAVPLPRPRADRTGGLSSPAVEPPLPRVPPAQRVDGAPPPVDRAVVTDLQRALAERGLYKGAIDGIPGSRTRAAISAYQQAEGLAVTGEASTDVLDHIRTASIAKPAPVEPPAARVAASPPPEVQPAPQAAMIPAENTAPDADPIASLVESPAKPVPSQVPAAAAAPPSAIAPAEASLPASDPAPALDPAAAERDRYVAVQHALNSIGYGPVTENGVIDRDTADAIRRFELDNGMPITGRPEERVVNRLISIGAMEAI